MAGLIELQVSLETFQEIANGLEAKEVKINSDANITLVKNIKIKGPIDYRQVQIRRDVLMEVVKVYKAPMIDDIELTDSQHFINFLDDVYKYVFKGEKPAATTPPNKIVIETQPNKTGWGKN